MIRIASVVTIYNPTEIFVKSIDSYRNQVDVVYAIDNSEFAPRWVQSTLRESPNVEYRRNGANLGVAVPVNYAARRAINEGYQYLLMMDQDSIAPPDLLESYHKYLVSCGGVQIGMLTPFHAYNNYARRRDPQLITEIPFAITSGTLMSLNAYQQCGPLLDDLFIDYVDVEYSLRIRAKGFKIVRLNDVILKHQLGALEPRYILKRRVAVYHHSPDRVYYKFRNRLLVSQLYRTVFPWWSLRELLLLMNELVKIALFEDQRWLKLRMAFSGVADYHKHRFGKIQVRG